MNAAIVVGVSDSPSSRAAIRWAMHRAAALALPVLLVHAVDDRWVLDSVGYNDWIRESSVKFLAAAKDHATKTEPTVTLTTDLVSGEPGTPWARGQRRHQSSLSAQAMAGRVARSPTGPCRSPPSRAAPWQLSARRT
ncbi:universal stress protein [Arthrobacter ulcerisalmonis]|uniref:universal stress protein n=1 Tax=Arthrobacter ulcerisalmonis TaxID=2483813 RepID=UPI00362DFAE1